MWTQTDDGWVNLDHVVSIERDRPDGFWRWTLRLVDGRKVEGNTIFTDVADIHQHEMEIISSIVEEERAA